MITQPTDTMNIEETGFRGLFLLKPKVYSDARGHFTEVYSRKVFKELGIDFHFVQDNQSSSKRGVIRGLHFQRSPHAQAKLVRVLRGTIIDIVLDLREQEPTFGKVYSGILSEDNMLQLLVPAGFAHGFAVLSERADVLYKCDQYYMPSSEGGINMMDEALGLRKLMPDLELIQSEKDQGLPSFAEFCAKL